MDTSITFRFPGVTVAEQEKRSAVPASPLAAQKSDSNISDEFLVAQICNGNKDALSLLFNRYSRLVRGVAYRVLRDSSEADDLVQDVFILLHRLCQNFDSSKGSARFWILQMTYHRALTRRRYLNTRHFYTRIHTDDPRCEVPDPRSESNGLHGSHDSALARADLQRIFSDLSENQRQTLQLFFVEGYTLGQIAARLKQSPSNIKHHYFRGLERLRKHFFKEKLRSNSAV